jgi:Fe-S-cluster containining protein
MNRADRKRQAKLDEKLVLKGLDADTTDPTTTAAMARQLCALFEKALDSGDIDAPVKFLHMKVTQTLAAVPIEVACGRGCTHCCNGWVSVTAPEILYAAKRVREKGEELAARVMSVHEATKAYSMAERPKHPHPCAMLSDGACGLYEARPSACRFASSMNASACERVFRLLQDDTIPSPMRHVRARERYQIALTTALVQAGLPHRFYDLTAGLARALSREDAEEAWLKGEDVFAGVAMDPTDVMHKESTQFVMRQAFGQAQLGLRAG